MRKHQTVVHNLYHFTFLLVVHKCSSLPNSLLSAFVFLVTILMGMKWCLIMVLILTSLITRDDEHLFMCLLAICISFLEKCVFESFAQFIIGLSFCCWVVRLLYVFWILDLYQIHDLKIFSLHRLSSFCWAENVWFDIVPLVYACFLLVLSLLLVSN